MKSRSVKVFCFIGLLTLADGGMLCAQTSTNVIAAKATNTVVRIPAPAATNAAVKTSVSAATNTIRVVQPLKPRAPTVISADRGEFDLANREVTYHGHVRVDDPEMKLTSEWLITDLPQPGEHVNHIVAETNVVIDFLDDRGKTNHATCDRTVYSYEVKAGITNELVTLAGSAKVENAEFVITGEPIVLNLVTRKITARNLVMIPRQSLINPNAETNSLPATRPPASPTNAPSANHQPGADTKFPPGKLDLVPEHDAPPLDH